MLRPVRITAGLGTHHGLRSARHAYWHTVGDDAGKKSCQSGVRKFDRTLVIRMDSITSGLI